MIFLVKFQSDRLPGDIFVFSQGEGIKDPLEIDDVLRANPYYFEQPNVLEKMMDFNRRKEIYKKP